MLGDILKEVRKQFEFTQEKLPHELDTSFSRISKWKNWHTSPSKLDKWRLLKFCKNNNVNMTIISELEEL